MIVLTCSVPIAADQAQYIYDALGRLVGVIDGNGDLATYRYDPVGNLLEIKRFGNGGGRTQGMDIALVSPRQGLPGREVTIRGVGFSTISSEKGL